MPKRYEPKYYSRGVCFYRNKDEIASDGVSKIAAPEFSLVHHELGKTAKGATSFNIDRVEFVLPNSAHAFVFITCAVLRIGMLLRDSEFAKEIHTQLLNGFKRLTPEQKFEDLDIEISIGTEIGLVIMRGDNGGH